MKQEAIPASVSSGLLDWTSLHALVTITKYGLNHMRVSLGPVGPESFALLSMTLESVARSMMKRPLPGQADVVVDVFADADVRAADVAALLDVIEEIERRTHLPLRARIVFRHAESISYQFPPATPDWVSTSVREWRGETERTLGARARDAFAKVSGDCKQVLAPADFIGRYGADRKREEEVLAALRGCDCAGVDRDAFAGLLLGLVAYRSPYGVWPVALPSDAGVRTVTVPVTATMADVASVLSKDASGTAFRLQLKN